MARWFFVLRYSFLPALLLLRWLFPLESIPSVIRLDSQTMMGYYAADFMSIFGRGIWLPVLANYYDRKVSGIIMVVLFAALIAIAFIMSIAIGGSSAWVLYAIDLALGARWLREQSRSYLREYSKTYSNWPVYSAAILGVCTFAGMAALGIGKSVFGVDLAATTQSWGSTKNQIPMPIFIAYAFVYLPTMGWIDRALANSIAPNSD